MVRAKLGHYYTMKVLQENPLRVQVLKWEETGDGILDTYTVDPYNYSPAGGCSCPAWTNECKHRRAVDEATKDGSINEAWKYRWEERKVDGRATLVREDIHDIMSIEELEERFKS